MAAFDSACLFDKHPPSRQYAILSRGMLGLTSKFPGALDLFRVVRDTVEAEATVSLETFIIARHMMLSHLKTDDVSEHGFSSTRPNSSFLRFSPLS